MFDLKIAKKHKIIQISYFYAIINAPILSIISIVLRYVRMGVSFWNVCNFVTVTLIMGLYPIRYRCVILGHNLLHITIVWESSSFNFFNPEKKSPLTCFSIFIVHIVVFQSFPINLWFLTALIISWYVEVGDIFKKFPNFVAVIMIIHSYPICNKCFFAFLTIISCT